MDRDRLLRLQPSHARSHRELMVRIGGIWGEVVDRLLDRGSVRILEIGCGFGTVLMELRRMFGDRVELYGINLGQDDGDRETCLQNAVERGLFSCEEVGGVEPPDIRFLDATRGLPFPSNQFDVVYSQVAWKHFTDKVFAFREVNRVLRADGLAKIDFRPVLKELPSAYREQVEIWDQGRPLDFWEHLGRDSGFCRRTAEKRPYLEITKSKDFAYDLGLVLLVRLDRLNPGWSGLKSVYKRYPAHLSPAGDMVILEVAGTREIGACYKVELPLWPTIQAFTLFEEESPVGHRVESIEPIREIGGGSYMIARSSQGVELFYSIPNNELNDESPRRLTLRGRSLGAAS